MLLCQYMYRIPGIGYSGFSLSYVVKMVGMEWNYPIRELCIVHQISHGVLTWHHVIHELQ